MIFNRSIRCNFNREMRENREQKNGVSLVGTKWLRGESFPLLNVVSSVESLLC